MTLRISFLLLLLGLVGCEPSTLTVEGTIKFNGIELEEGFISFNPVDGQGRTAGAPIKKGRYQIIGLTPGKRILDVSSSPHFEAPKTLPDDPTQLKMPNKPGPVIQPDDIGNRQTIDIAESRHIDLEIMSKEKR